MSDLAENGVVTQQQTTTATANSIGPQQQQRHQTKSTSGKQKSSMVVEANSGTRSELQQASGSMSSTINNQVVEHHNPTSYPTKQQATTGYLRGVGTGSDESGGSYSGMLQHQAQPMHSRQLNHHSMPQHNYPHQQQHQHYHNSKHHHSGNNHNNNHLNHLTKGDTESNVNHVLLITVINPHYPITCDLIHQICGTYGKVNRIVIFKKNGVQAMVEFDNVESAKRAKSFLHGCDIYSGCCTLRIEFAKPTKLNVHKNDSESFDYTNPSLGTESNAEHHHDHSHQQHGGHQHHHHSPHQHHAATTHHRHAYQSNAALHHHQHHSKQSGPSGGAMGGHSGNRRGMNSGDGLGGGSHLHHHHGHHHHHHQQQQQQHPHHHPHQHQNPFHQQHPQKQQQQHQQSHTSVLPNPQVGHQHGAHHYGGQQGGEPAFQQQPQENFAMPRSNVATHQSTSGPSASSAAVVVSPSSSTTTTGQAQQQQPQMGEYLAMDSFTIAPAQNPQGLHVGGNMFSRHDNPGHHHHQHHHHQSGRGGGGGANAANVASESDGLNHGSHHHHGHHHSQFVPQNAAALMTGPGAMFSQGTVMMVYGLNLDRISCDRLFNLFCLYGNVARVKFLRTKEGCAMVQMGDVLAVDRCVSSLNKITLFGNELQISYSKQAFLHDVIKPFILPDGSPSFKDYMGNKNNRFKNPEVASKNRILPPSAVLHFFNAPFGISEDELLYVFKQTTGHEPVALKIFSPKIENTKSYSGLVTFRDPVEATEALVLFNHLSMPRAGAPHPYILRLCFSPPTYARQHHQNQPSPASSQVAQDTPAPSREASVAGASAAQGIDPASTSAATAVAPAVSPSPVATRERLPISG